jgi:polyhydroxybutyrate depolymerase
MKSFVLFLFLSIFSFKNKCQVLQSLNHNGVDRVYFYYVPSDYSTDQSLPLLLVLHGLTQTGGGVMDITNFNEIAEQEKFIAVYPSGLSNAWNANMNVSVSTADDKGFLEALISYFQQNFNTNPYQQYLCGFSNGAFMSHKMACESDLCFAAIATVSGTMSDTVYANCNPSHKTSVLHIHGTADAVVPYNGGVATGASVEMILEKWRNYLGCAQGTTTIDLPNTNLFDLSSAQRITYSACGGQALEHIKVSGGGHQWPGISTWNGGVGTINMDFYSPQIIWEFLASKSCATSGLSEEELAWEMYPNPANEILVIKTKDNIEKVIVHDYTGKKLLEIIRNNEEVLLDIGGLKNGIYFIALSDKAGNQVGKTKSLIKN